MSKPQGRFRRGDVDYQWVAVDYKCPHCPKAGTLNFAVTSDGFFYPEIPSHTCEDYFGPVCLVGDYRIIEVPV
jgi:hypothetical protein